MGSSALWDAETNHSSELKGHNSAIAYVSFSADSKELASCCEYMISIWNIVTGVSHAFYGSNGRHMFTAAFSPDGKRAASSGCSDGGGTIEIWDVKLGISKHLEGHTATAYSLIFSPNGTRLASCSNDGTMRIWDSLTSNPHSFSTPHSPVRNRIAWSPDGEYIASNGSFNSSGRDNNTIYLWNLKTGFVLEFARPTPHQILFRSLAFSSDGKFVAAGTSDKLVRVWATETGALVAGPLKGHTSEVWCATFSPRDSHVVSVCLDGTVRAWGY